MKINKADRNAILSRLFGNNIARARERVAAVLIMLHISPNMLTFAGTTVTLAAAVCLGIGAGDRPPWHDKTSEVIGTSWYGVWGMAGIFLASCFDILDGAVAKNSNRITPLGGFLDSCLDRVSDAAVFLGIMIYYLYRPELPGANVFAIAAMVSLANALIISYVKARAENSIEKCPVGYWQRGERLAAIMIGLVCGHTGTVMIMLAILPALTVLRRFIFAARQLDRSHKKLPLLDPAKQTTGIMQLALWRYRRGSLPYDIVTASNIALILLIDLQAIYP
jgi:CDP-diacylglycerol---glycerol-3-phosphate 3-phosphatidyltransferase